MGSSKKHKKHKDKDKDKKSGFDENAPTTTATSSFDQRPLKLVLKVGSTSTTVEGSPSRIPVLPPIPELSPQIFEPSSHPPPSMDPTLAGHELLSSSSAKKKEKKKKSKKKHKKHSHHHHHHHHHTHECSHSHRHKSTCHRSKSSSSHTSNRDFSMTDVSQVPTIEPALISSAVDPSASVTDATMSLAVSIPPEEEQNRVEPMDVTQQAARSPHKVSLKDIDPNLYYNFLTKVLQTLQKKDPHDFFAWPVTDAIAPGYSSIIPKPMDFSTIQRKIEYRVYDSPADMKADVKLMCDNAMTYNLPDTIYYKAAKKLWHYAKEKVFTRESLNDLRYQASFMPPPPPQPPAVVQNQFTATSATYSIPFSDITNAAPSYTETVDGSQSAQEKEQDDEDAETNRILEQARAAAATAAERLSLAKPNGAHFSFIRQRPDGSTSLAVIGAAPAAERYLKIDDVVGKLPEGTPYLSPYTEPESSKVKSIDSLNTGPFGSYIPSIDSSKSKLTKEETSLLLSTYGDEETGIPYAKSLLEFAGDSDYILRMADSLLDVLTQGQHSKCLTELKELEEKQRKDEEKAKEAEQNKETSNSEEKQSEEPSEEDNQTSKKLKEAQKLVQELESIQRKRLSKTTRPTHPSSEEVKVANLLTTKLTQMISTMTAPIDVADIKSIRKALGVAPKE